MDEEYLTIKEAREYTGKSDESVRRLIRHIRAKYMIQEDISAEELEAKTSLLRKTNVRRDVTGKQIFEWLIAKSELEPSLTEQSPKVPASNEQQPVLEDAREDTQTIPGGTHEDAQPSMPEDPTEDALYVPKSIPVGSLEEVEKLRIQNFELRIASQAKTIAIQQIQKGHETTVSRLVDAVTDQGKRIGNLEGQLLALKEGEFAESPEDTEDAVTREDYNR